MSLLQHLEELRVRLTRVIIAAVIGFGICFAFAERILEVMLRPLKQVLPQSSVIQTTALTEGFFVSMKAAFVAGIFLASPFIFHQIWSFIAPGLYEEERKLAIPVAFFTALCFVSGACFGYFIVFPFGFTFLANYASDIVTLNPKLSEYYSMALGLLFAFGIIFEMPVFIFFLARFGVVDHKWLRAKRRWAIVIIFIVAAIVTPTPDVVNQLLMAAPMVILYEVGIWVAYFFGKKPKPAEGDETLPAVQGEGGPEGAPAAASDAALEEAQASESHGAQTPVLPEGGPSVEQTPGTPELPTPGESEASSGAPVPAPAVDAQAAEREAHDVAALGHDEAAPLSAGQAAAKPDAPAEAASGGQPAVVKAPADEAPKAKPGGENKS
nr:twin-arginine translocase subunit TatC [Fundidesulfovibrio terrae]